MLYQFLILEDSNLYNCDVTSLFLLSLRCFISLLLKSVQVQNNQNIGVYSTDFQFQTTNCLQCFAVLAGDPNDDKKAEAQPKGHTGKTILFVLLGVGAVILLSFFIFKYWQKKKREEQHARLLKLFEEDDDIEVELGLRD